MLEVKGIFSFNRQVHFYGQLLFFSGPKEEEVIYSYRRPDTTIWDCKRIKLLSPIKEKGVPYTIYSFIYLFTYYLFIKRTSSIQNVSIEYYSNVREVNRIC